MANHEHTNPILDERTIPNHGRSLDDFEPETRTLTEIYIVDRKRRNNKVAGMVEPYKQQEIDRASGQLSELYRELLQKYANDPEFITLGPSIWLLRKTANAEGQELKIHLTFIGGRSPSEADNIHVHVYDNLKSYLAVDSVGGTTRETFYQSVPGDEVLKTHERGRHVEVAFPATLVDARYYRKIVNAI